MGGAKKAVKKAVGGVRKAIGKAGPVGNVVNTTLDIGTGGTYRVLAGKGGLLGRDAKMLIGKDGQKIPMPEISGLEAKYGILRPEYESLRGGDGQLRSEFRYDPTKSAAFQKLQEQAMAAPGQSPWARMQMEKQALEQSGAADAAAKAALQGTAQAQSNLARFGGLSGGARERLQAGGAQQLARAQQDVARQGMLSRLGITESDIARQQQALGAVGSEELKGQAANLEALRSDVTGKQMFDIAKYKEQMAALGAEKTANAQVAAANRSGKK